MNTVIVYFSGTGNTKIIAKEIQKGLKLSGSKTSLIDITSYNSRKKKIDLVKFDLLVFGFPVYASTIPLICIDWLKTLKGQNKPAAMFFTYGGPTMGVAHFHTKDLLNEQDFLVIGTAEFPCKHSFNLAKGFEFLKDRPNKTDLKQAQEYGVGLENKFSLGKLNEIIIPFIKPENYNAIVERINIRKKRTTESPPSRYSKDCSMCRTCEKSCPTAAFNADTGVANGEKCIACMRCVTFCPDNVIEYRRDMSGIFQRLKDHYNLTEERMKSLGVRYAL
ncbi:MAG: hypothetical protein FK733_17900 [Asgard group archaeon]|nr:hypothetical protein [Asgard group archaeon]